VSSRMEAGARVDPWRRRRGFSGGGGGEVPWGKRQRAESSGSGDGDGDDVLLCSMRRLVARVRGSSYAGGRHAMSSCQIVMPSRYAVRPYRYAMSSCQIVMPCACILDHAMRVDRNADSKERCVHVDSKRRENGAEEALWGVITSGGPRDLCASERRERERHHRPEPSGTTKEGKAPRDETRRTTPQRHPKAEGAGKGEDACAPFMCAERAGMATPSHPTERAERERHHRPEPSGTIKEGKTPRDETRRTTPQRHPKAEKERGEGRGAGSGEGEDACAPFICAERAGMATPSRPQMRVDGDRRSGLR
jgi:hypothetical protein